MNNSLLFPDCLYIFMNCKLDINMYCMYIVYSFYSINTNSIQCLVNLLFYIILNTALLLAAEKSDPRDYSQPVDKFRGVCEATYLLYVFWLIFGEVNQFRK